MSDEAMKADDAAPDYRKAMLYHSDRADEFMGQRDDALRALAAEQEKVARLVEALAPFATFADAHVDAEGWKAPPMGERICDWFGPSDFREARGAIASVQGEVADG